MVELINKEKKLLEILNDIFIFVIIVLFPISIDKTGYFNILEHKWHLFLYIGILYIIFTILILVYYEIIKKTKYIKSIKLDFTKYFLISFLIINIISSFASPFYNKYNIFVGVGRGEGLIMITLYSLTFLLVSIFGKFKKKYYIYFAITSIIVSLIGILQFCGLNPLNLYQKNIGIYNVSFLTTIGNIDFVSAFYCLYLTLSVGAFIFLEKTKKIEKIIYLLSILLGVYIIIMINVKSGQVGFLITAIIMLPYIIIKHKRLSRFMIVLSTILTSFLLNMLMGTKYNYILEKFTFNFKFNYITILYIFTILFLIGLSKYIYNKKYDFSKNKKIIKNLYLLIVICILTGVIILYFYDFKSGILYEIHQILKGNFDDSFGTYRMFLWKRTIKIFPDYFLLGTGPDTFAIRFMEKFTSDIAAIGSLTINDTAANVYLTILINSGILGMSTYILFLISLISKGIKKLNTITIVSTITVICYIIQDFFNLSVVIITPLFWLTMAINCLSLNENK